MLGEPLEDWGECDCWWLWGRGYGLNLLEATCFDRNSEGDGDPEELEVGVMDNAEGADCC